MMGYFSAIKRKTSESHNNMDDSQNHYSERKKPDKKENTSFDYLYYYSMIICINSD